MCGILEDVRRYGGRNTTTRAKIRGLKIATKNPKDTVKMFEDAFGRTAYAHEPLGGQCIRIACSLIKLIEFS